MDGRFREKVVDGDEGVGVGNYAGGGVGGGGGDVGA